jgi:hypothetical protein
VDKSLSFRAFLRRGGSASSSGSSLGDGGTGVFILNGARRVSSFDANGSDSAGNASGGGASGGGSSGGGEVGEPQAYVRADYGARWDSRPASLNGARGSSKSASGTRQVEPASSAVGGLAGSAAPAAAAPLASRKLLAHAAADAPMPSALAVSFIA